METISENICQLSGVAFGIAAAAAVSLLGESKLTRSDYEELNLLQTDALTNASKKGLFSDKNSKGVIVLGSSSLDNAEYFVSSLVDARIPAVVLNSCIEINLSEYLKDASSYAENSLYADLIESGLILTPGKDVGLYYALRVHFNEELVLEILRRFETFKSKRNSSSATKATEENSEKPETVINSVSSDSNLLVTPVSKGIIKGSKAKTVSKAIGTSRKRKMIEEEEDIEITEKDDDFSAHISVPASALKTPAARRKSVAIDTINQDVSSTARKGRSRKLD